MCYVCAMYSVTLEASSALHNAYTTRLVNWTHVRKHAFSPARQISESEVFASSTFFRIPGRSLRLADVQEAPGARRTFLPIARWRAHTQQPSASPTL